MPPKSKRERIQELLEGLPEDVGALPAGELDAAEQMTDETDHDTSDEG